MSELYFNITEKAAAQVKSIQAKDGLEGTVLRIAVVGGGCSGLSYKLSFATSPKDGDKTVELHGVTLIVDQKSYLFIKGMVLDYTDGLDGQGFIFENPNAKQKCGCGTSFSA